MTVRQLWFLFGAGCASLWWVTLWVVMAWLRAGAARREREEGP